MDAVIAQLAVNRLTVIPFMIHSVVLMPPRKEV
jgi:hypothetical protein